MVRVDRLVVVSLEDESTGRILGDDPVQDLGALVRRTVGRDITDLVAGLLRHHYEIAPVVDRVHADALGDHVTDLTGQYGPHADGRHSKNGGHDETFGRN